MTYQGHNSASYGEELQAELETVLSDDHQTIFHYAQWHINDYITGTTGMTLEHEGAYIRFLMRLYQRGKPLPDDDRFMATCMALSVRVWRRVKETLVKFGKIIQRNGCLTNPRFEKERQRRAAQIKNQAHAARKRWDRERAQKAGIKKVSPNFSETFAKSLSELSQNRTKKARKINLLWVMTHMLTNNQYPIIKVRKNPPVVPPGGKARQRACQLPESWQPKEQTLQTVRNGKIGATDEQISWQLEKFRNHARGKGRKQKDWDAAFRNWMMNAKSFGELERDRGKKSRYNSASYDFFYYGVE